MAISRIIRSDAVVAGLFLLLVATLMTWWLSIPAYEMAPISPPGQYQLHQQRWQWPGVEKIATYIPQSATNRVKFYDAPQPKELCWKGVCN